MGRKICRDLQASAAIAIAGIVAAAAVAPSRASACGGFFCSSANPVNQAAEQIIFVDNGDGTVTAVIQIMYQGPADSFAWVLPVPGVPDVQVSSDQALDALKQFTNPTYRLITTFGPGCSFPGSAASGSAGGFAPPGVPQDDSGVSVQASGAVGPYLYDVISVDPMLPDVADAAINWLTDNAYDVGDIGPDVLRPYLEEQLNLIAFKLQKGNSSGSIRPVMLTYESALPSIPIRPTAVAANDDMGVMVWLLSDARGIPENYKALELNEALIDWFNPNNTYNDVVTAAANEAQGQGFVTEYAGPTQTLFDNGLSVFPDFQEQQWTAFSSQQHTDPIAMVQQAGQNWSAWDGFDDALRAAVMLPDTIEFDDFRRCMACYISQPGVTFDTTVYLRELYEKVIKPVADTQTLLESRPYITRLYTTMSADEMTMDPVFAFNPDLDDVSNVHTADQVIECVNGSPTGPWTVSLAQGNTVRGTQTGTWPIDIDSMPAALKIIEFGTSGQGITVVDNTPEVDDAMSGDGGVMTSAGRGGSGSSGSGGGGAGTGQTTRDAGVSDVDAGGPDGDDDEDDDDDGCSVARGRAAPSLVPVLLALAALARRRRTRTA
jgi:hypothetical protein